MDLDQVLHFKLLELKRTSSVNWYGLPIYLFIRIVCPDPFIKG